MRRLPAALIGALALIGVLLPGLCFTPAAAQSTPTIELVAQTPFVRPGDEFSVTIRVTGAATTDVASLAFARVASDGSATRQRRDELRSDRQLDFFTGNLVSLKVFDLSGGVTTTLRVETPRLPPGIYAVGVGIGPRSERRPRQALGTSAIIVPDTAVTPPLAVTVVVPFTARPALRPDGQIKIDSFDRSRLSTLVDRVQALPTAVLAISPQLVNALGTSTNTDDELLIGRLRSLARSRDVMALPYVDIDEEAWRAAGLDKELSELYAYGREKLQEVLDIEPVSGTILTDPSTTTETLRFFGDLGARLFVVNEESLEALPQKQWPRPPTKPFSVTGASGVAVAVDPELRRLFSGDSVLNANRLLADLSAAYFEVFDSREPRAREEAHGVVVLVPEDWSASTQFLNALADGLSANPILKATNFDAIFRLGPSAQSGDTAVATPSTALQRTLQPALARALDAYPQRLRSTAARLESLRTMIAKPDIDHRELILVSGDQRLDSNERNAYLDAVNNYINANSSGLKFAKHATLTLTSQRGTVNVTVDNPFLHPLSVRLEFLSDSRIDFPEGRVRDDIVLQPGQNTIPIEVRSRISGDTKVEVRLTTRDAGGLGTLASDEFRIRAVALSGVGIALSALALLVLFIWWFKQVKAKRRVRRAVTA